jgi:geranylgeranyl pyrophosphate synthase
MTQAARAEAEAPRDLKRMPAAAERLALRRAVASSPRPAGEAPDRAWLEARGRELLQSFGLDPGFLGFAMVELSNAWWRDAFATVPCTRRLLLLPHCLRDAAACQAPTDQHGLHCLRCGGCDIAALQQEAEALGYRVLVAEGTGVVTGEFLDHDRDAVLGVACLDSLEKSFARVTELGIPHLAVPLLADGCVDTEVEMELVRELIALSTTAPAPPFRTWLPLLREAGRLFEPGAVAALLAPIAAATEVDAIAAGWLAEGGKRLRTFIVLAAYVVGRHGLAALRADADLAALAPAPVRRLAAAIEILHKASLVHDDIEDAGDFRYGRPTLHRVHGVPAAINAGDHLVGLGYRLVAALAGDLGAEPTLAILDHLAAAHLDLCRGQGSELALRHRRDARLDPLAVLDIYAGKTAPAFATALHAGLRAAGVAPDMPALERFARYLGEAYQVRNDLDDWQADDANKVELGQDAVMAQPTILRAFALEAGGAEELAAQPGEGVEAFIERVRQIYEVRGVFVRTRLLIGKLRTRALAAAAELSPPELRELGTVLVRVILGPDVSG